MIKAITRIDPNAQVTVSDNDFSKIIWHDGNPNNITLEQVQAAQVEIQAEYDAQEYARNRQEEYPSLNELIVALWENVVEERAASVIALETKRQEIKTKYPK